MSMIVTIDLTALWPYIVSVLITLAYALVGYGSSGEAFDQNKFAVTMGVQLAALIGAAFVGSPILALFTPSLITIFVTKAISWIKKAESARAANKVSATVKPTAQSVPAVNPGS